MVHVHRLSDGTAVWLDPMRDVKSVALGVYVAGGSADEEPEILGATHFLEHLLFKRTRRRSGAAIARTTDRIGGECDAYTTKESVVFHARTPAERLPEALSLLLDLTEAPAFTAEDVDVERRVILEEMAEANDVPEDRLHDTFVRALFPTHPLGAPVLGHEETVRGLSRSSLASRFRAIFRPDRTAIVAAGAFEPARLLDLVSKERETRRRSKEAAASAWRTSAPSPRAARCAFHIPRPELSQTHVLVGGATIPYGHRLVPAASIGSVVLGGGVSSRLWRDVRERHGLAYHVSCGVMLHRAAGVALIEAATAPKNLPRLVRTMGRILKRVVSDGVTNAELLRAKNQLRAEVALSLESTVSRREAAARAWLFRGRPHEAEEVLAEIDAVRPHDVANALQLLFGPSARTGLGVTGPEPEASVDDLAAELAA